MTTAPMTMASRHVAMAALAENVRVVTSVIHDAITLRDLRAFRRRVKNVRAATAEIRQFTDLIEVEWDSFSNFEKRRLYDIALHAARAPELAARGPRPTSLRFIWMQLVLKDLTRTLDEAEEAIFWFGDTIFSKAEDETPAYEAMIAARVDEAEAAGRELERVVG